MPCARRAEGVTAASLAELHSVGYARLVADSHGPHRRFLARPRRFGTGLALSVALHAGLAVLFVVIWSLLPLPPIQPIRVYLDLDHAPTREQIDVDPQGRPRWLDEGGRPRIGSAP
jgi:hypothetical protein